MRNFVKYLVLIIAVFVINYSAQARPIVGDVSPRKIDIDHNFKGTDLLAYGARSDGGNVVIVVRGPKQKYLLREKGKVAGIWTNVNSIEIDDITNFYNLSSQKLLKKSDSRTNLKKLEVGLKSISVKPADMEEKDYSKKELANIRNKVVQLLTEKGLYTENEEQVSFWEETLFRSHIHFPKNISKGIYSMDIYLFRDGILTSFQTLPIIVENVGFEAFMNNFAHQHAWLYGLMCVALAVFMGFFVNFLSHQRH